MMIIISIMVREVKEGHRVKTTESYIHNTRSPRHLYLCRIRCNFGTDDIFFPFLIAFAIRATWLARLLYAYLKKIIC